MKAATQTAGSRRASEPRRITRTAQRLVSWINDLSFAEKLYGVVVLLVIVTIFLLVMSIQSVRLQSSYRNLEASSFRAATDIGRVNALIYAVVMESRGIYMSAERDKVRQYADTLLKRNRELAVATLELEKTVGASDPVQFSAFKQRILQFVDFREELVRRALVIGPAGGRAWGDNDANRALRTQLNTDLEAFAALYQERARKAAELGDLGQYACWYLFGLGLAALAIAAVNLQIVRRSVIRPLSEIIQLSYRIANGDIKSEIPYFGRRDEIGQLAVVLGHFRDAVERNQEMEQRELDMAKQRDTVIAERDEYSDRYLETKWQLQAAINSMPQGMIMLDSKANVLVINDHYRQMYRLPATIKVGSSLQDIVQYRIDGGQLAGDATKYVSTILERIGKRKPTTIEMTLQDKRIIRIQENPFDGGGWAAMHEDITEQSQRQRILKRTEHFLATLIENIPEGILAKDARNLRYVFVNKAAETMIGLPRTEMIGKTARELFSAETAELIERRDRQLIAQKQQLETIVDTVFNPRKGLRKIAWRRLQIGGPDDESHLFVSMFEDWTDRAEVTS
jgi:PAS domain S-box-containing protein